MTDPLVHASWDPAIRSRSADELGAKAHNLLRLPPEWVPPFVVFGGKFQALAKSDGVETAMAALNEVDAAAIAHVFDIAADHVRNDLLSAGPSVFVRSDAAHEGPGLRGAFDSFAVPAALEEMTGAVEEVLGQAIDMRVMVQPVINGSRGVLSNERRSGPGLDEAAVEGLPGQAGSLVSLRARRAPRGELAARSAAQVESQLRGVLGWVASELRREVTIEWVWDGAVLWAVQLDLVTPPVRDRRESDYFPAANGPLRNGVGDQQDPRHASHAFGQGWRKLRCLKAFADVGLVGPDVFLITGAEWQIQRDATFDWLASRVDGLWVVRTDALPGSGIGADLLPTSEPTADVHEMARFMDDVTASILDMSGAPSDWAFLPAPLIRARVSSLSSARPRGDDVFVHALWGLPDGLLHLPHDEYLVRSDGSIGVDVRYKPSAIIADEMGWATIRLGSDHDWRQTLPEEAVEQTARMAQILSDHLDEPVQLMALHYPSGDSSQVVSLPFHFMVGAIRTAVPGARAGLGEVGKGVALIARESDLEAASRRRDLTAFLVRPGTDQRRSIRLLENAGLTALDLGVPVLFEGSILGHSFQVLSSTGASVVPSEPSRLIGTVTRYDKLVRDSIPAMIEEAGAVARVRSLVPSEALPLLKRKLLEESYEALAASDAALIEELADVREVIEALEQQLPDGPATVRRAMLVKREARGGFGELVFLEATAEGGELSATGDLVRSDDVRVHVGPSLFAGDVHMEIPVLPPHQSTTSRVVLEMSSSSELEVLVKYDEMKVVVSLSKRARIDTKQGSLFEAGESDQS